MYRILTALALLALVSSANAQTSLWKISNTTHHLYLGGTIHMLSKSDFPLPQEYESVYQLAQKLVLETDLLELQQPQMQQLLLKKVSYSNGKSLKTELSPQTYRQVDDFMRSRGMSIATFDNIKPSMLSITLSVMEMKRLGLTSVGVDQHFYDKAKTENKRTGQLESPEQQIDFIANMGSGNEDALLLNTLRDMENLAEMLTDIKQSWRQGDEEGLIRSALAPMQQDYPDLYQSLLVERNRNWLPKIEGMLTSNEVELVLVGALHLVGTDGLLEALRGKGYTVKQVN